MALWVFALNCFTKTMMFTAKTQSAMGMITPVFALNCFTKSMMFTPWGPRAVPTGGAGVACPAGTCSFTIAITGFAIVFSSRLRGPQAPTGYRRGGRRQLVSLQLQIIQLHRRRPPEQRHRHPHLSFIGEHLFHRAAEIRERPLGDLHHLADEERDLLLRLFLGHRLCDAQQAVHFVGAQRHRQPAGAHELDDALNTVDDVDRFLVERHLHQDVSRVHLPLDRHFLAVLDLHHFLGGDQALTDRALGLGPRVFLDPPLHQRADLVLMTGGDLDRVPAVLAHRNRLATPVTKMNCSSVSISPMNTPSSATKMTITSVALRSSSVVGQVTFWISPRTSRKKSISLLTTFFLLGASASVATATSIPCAPPACCSGGSTCSTPPAPDASAGSWS